MSGKRIPMRKLRKILQLKHEAGLSHRSIAKGCSVSIRTITQYLQRVKEAGL